uniref:Putative dna repair protein xrcc1 anoplophora glabripennis n=1 Tax=Lutzomyia longipalpis TaxID=7200 RepID=A0A1B0GII8_LUTLO
MPRVHLKSVYSFSSEDPAFPASNLLKNQKWRSQGVGQETEHVTIELEKPTTISGIDLGNESSCFIGVFVARKGQEMNAENYQEILLTASFMTPIDCRSLENVNRVRCFGKAALVEDVVKEKWDFVKIVCSQPFNAHTQYGLSFITIYSPEEEIKEEAKKLEISSPLGRFALREESPEVEESGSLFNKWKQSNKGDQQAGTSATTTIMSPALAIRKASKELLATNANASTTVTNNNNKVENTENTSPLLQQKTPPPPRRNRIIYDSEDSDEDNGASAAKKTKIKETPKPNKPQEAPKPNKPKETTKIDPISPKKRVTYQPFSRFLSGVIYTISGIQNPERGTLRQKATEMGARYKPDWDSTCTHLICAFRNTPKYNQVRGSGKIVQKNWILDCYSKRTRFPWRRYALDRNERDESESEDEVHDEARRPAGQSSTATSTSRNRIVDSSGSDTEDEIQKVLAEKASEKDIYDKTTEEEDEGHS